jgi:release factor H-coupled RctB family protein
MGNSVFHGRDTGVKPRAAIHKFYSQKAWIETRAEDRPDLIAGWTGVRKIAAFPDLHPGKYGPVGCAVLADRIFPQLAGSDIGCGMSLFRLDLALRKFKPEKAARRLRALGDPPEADYGDDPEQAGLARDLFAGAPGSIGGGNHFCEVRTLVECAPETGLDKTRLYLLVHSGSRGLGNAVLEGLPHGAFDRLDPGGETARNYLAGHDRAVIRAGLNRRIIARRAAAALRADLVPVADAPHNMISHSSTGWLHRKGAARADGGLVPLAGSRATPGYLLEPLPDMPDALHSLAHGAGRKYDRSSMHGRVRGKKSDLDKMQRTALGGRVICEEKTGVARAVAMFHPLLTFKKIRKEGRR